MTKILIVGGTFDTDGGKPSTLINLLYNELCKETSFNPTLVNGGALYELHNNILPAVLDYQIVLWFANVPNEALKLRDVKAINPKILLVTSKRNDNNKYTFAELISRALSIKANLTVEFSKTESGLFNMMLFDPLGNVFYNGSEITNLSGALVARLKQLLTFTRVPTVQDFNSPAPSVPEETAFFDFAHDCADIFHNLIRPAKGTERFLGNMSFRCQNGFPSFRGENGIIYVSKRNVDKSEINAQSFVPVYLDEWNTTKYFGENKPSVDTPVQVRLYKEFAWANYMIHAHCYVDTHNIPDAFMLYTSKPIPCGALEEVTEIINTYNSFLKPAAFRLLAINLLGHGCILIAKDLEILKELQTQKNNCFVQRPMPEVFGGVIDEV